MHTSFRNLLVVTAATMVLTTGLAQAEEIGVHINAFGGLGMANTEVSGSSGVLNGELDGLGAEGAMGGLRMGYDIQVENMLFGIEGSYSFDNIKTTFNGSSGSSSLKLTGKRKWDASVSVRTGVKLNPETLLYVNGGMSYASFKAKASLSSAGSASVTKKFRGWHTGAGTEMSLSDNMALRLEYRYTQYDDKEWNYATGESLSLQPSVHTITAGVSWRF